MAIEPARKPLPKRPRGQRKAPPVSAVQERSRWLFARHLAKLGKILDGSFVTEQRRYVVDKDGNRILTHVTTTGVGAKDIAQALELVAAYGGLPRFVESVTQVDSSSREVVEKLTQALRELHVRDAIAERYPRIAATISTNGLGHEETVDVQVLPPQELTSETPLA